MPAVPDAPARALGRDLELPGAAGGGGPALDRIRAALAPFRPREVRPDDVRAAYFVVAEHATISPYAPVAARHPAIARVKEQVRRATFFLAHHLALEVTQLGHAVVMAGSATAERIERLEREQAELRRELERLREAVGGPASEHRSGT